MNIIDTGDVLKNRPNENQSGMRERNLDNAKVEQDRIPDLETFLKRASAYELARRSLLIASIDIIIFVAKSRPNRST